MKARDYTHAIQIDAVKCIGCSHCMQVCPMKAIRIIDGCADIMPELCVDCGECYRVCPADAIYVQDDDLSKIYLDKYCIALVPSVFIAQFSKSYPVAEILEAIKEIGFDEVYEVENAVDFIKERYSSISKQNHEQTPLISSYCPAIVRLIQTQYRSLTGNIIPIKAPHDIAALYLRKTKAESGISPDNISIYYITPCASKIVAARAPVGEEKSVIDGTFDMVEIYNEVSKNLLRKSTDISAQESAGMSPDSIKWSISGTEKQYYPGRSLAIDGMDNAMEFLDQLESGKIKGVDFLEMRACDQGCAGGILCPGNRFVTVERLEKRMTKITESVVGEEPLKNRLMDYAEILRKDSKTDPVNPRYGLLLDENIEIALRKMERIKKLNSYLPGFDCGACGAPTCKSLAEDIVKERATISHCVFIQRVMEKNYNLSPEQAFRIIENIWGKNRLSKHESQYGDKEFTKTD